MLDFHFVDIGRKVAAGMFTYAVPKSKVIWGISAAVGVIVAKNYRIYGPMIENEAIAMSINVWWNGTVIRPIRSFFGYPIEDNTGYWEQISSIANSFGNFFSRHVVSPFVAEQTSSYTHQYVGAAAWLITAITLNMIYQCCFCSKKTASIVAAKVLPEDIEAKENVKDNDEAKEDIQKHSLQPQAPQLVLSKEKDPVVEQVVRPIPTETEFRTLTPHQEPSTEKIVSKPLSLPKVEDEIFGDEEKNGWKQLICCCLNLNED